MVIVGFVLLAGTGALARWQLAALNRPAFPAGTLVVNVMAAFVLGLLHDSGGDTHTLLGVALLGSASTFSTVIRELSGEREAADRGALVRYLGLTVVLGVGAAWLGVRLS